MGSKRKVVVAETIQRVLVSLSLSQTLDLFSSYWPLLSARMCIPTRVVCPTVSSTAGFIRANVSRINKTRPCPASPSLPQTRNFSFKTNTNSNYKMHNREQPACPVVTYFSILSIFTLILCFNFQHGVGVGRIHHHHHTR